VDKAEDKIMMNIMTMIDDYKNDDYNKILFLNIMNMIIVMRGKADADDQKAVVYIIGCDYGNSKRPPNLEY